MKKWNLKLKLWELNHNFRFNSKSFEWVFFLNLQIMCFQIVFFQVQMFFFPNSFFFSVSDLFIFKFWSLIQFQIVGGHHDWHFWEPFWITLPLGNVGIVECGEKKYFFLHHLLRSIKLQIFYYVVGALTSIAGSLWEPGPLIGLSHW